MVSNWIRTSGFPWSIRNYLGSAVTNVRPSNFSKTIYILNAVLLTAIDTIRPTDTCRTIDTADFRFLFSDVQYEARDDFNDDIKLEVDAANYDATEIDANGTRHA